MIVSQMPMAFSFLKNVGNFQDNIHTLSQGLKNHESYIVRNGQLMIRANQSIWKKIAYFFLRGYEQKAVRKLISKTIKILTCIDWGHVDVAMRHIFKEFFFQKMACLPLNLFDRKSISKAFTYLLAPKLLKIDKNQKLERRIVKTRLALKLGIPFLPISQGRSGSYLTRDKNLKALGVFKPALEESLWFKSPKIISRIFAYTRRFFSQPKHPFWKNEGYLAEVMAFKLSEHLEFHLVPPTQVIRFKKAQGSFQIYVKNNQSVDRIFSLCSILHFLGFWILKLIIWLRRNRIRKKLIQSEFERMAFLDFIICNRDRHCKNWLLTADKQIGRYHIHLIDHQLSFPKYNPEKSDSSFRKNQYQWVCFPQACETFSEELKLKAHNLMKGEALRQLLITLRKENDPYGTGLNRISKKNQSQESAFKKRVAVLLKAIDEKYTIKMIAQLKSEEEMNEFLARYQINDIDSFLGLEG